VQLAIVKSGDGLHRLLHGLSGIAQIGTLADGDNQGLAHGSG
jgi:hypothetical protein